MFEDKGKEMGKIMEQIPLSRRTVARRTEIISTFLYSCTKSRLLDCVFYSLCLDESTDINDLSQLIVCVKSVNQNLDTTEEMLLLESMHGHVTGENLYKIINEKVFLIRTNALLFALTERKL